jgi:hypothetical protein
LTSEEQEIIEAVIRDSRLSTTGVLTDARIIELAKSKIRHGYAMAGRAGCWSFHPGARCVRPGHVRVRLRP